MLTIILLLLVAGWLGWSHVTQERQGREARPRTGEKVAVGQAALARPPESPSAHEALGDALREAGRAQEAVTCYRRALEMETAGGAQTVPSVTGLAASAGLHNKLRLTEGEA